MLAPQQTAPDLVACQKGDRDRDRGQVIGKCVGRCDERRCRQRCRLQGVAHLGPPDQPHDYRDAYGCDALHHPSRRGATV